jgi:hypothetical protein
MNIFDPLISGSLSVSGSGRISGDLTVLGTINATISGTTSNAISASHAASYTLTSSFGAFTSSYTTGSFTGSFGGDGSNLTNIPSSGVTGLNLTRIADGSATASISNIDGLRINTNTEITGALTISGSITLNGVPVGTGKLDEVVFNSYSSSNNTTNSLQNGRLDSLEVSTSSLNTFTSSATSRLNTIESTTGSLNTFTSSTNTILSVIETTTASLNTFTSSANGRLNSLETTSGSINTFTSSASGRLTSLESASGSIRTDFNSYTSSNDTTNTTQNGRLNSLETTTSSLNSYTSSTDNRLGIIETTTGSLNSYTSSNNTIIGTLQTATSSLNSYTSSNTTNINAIHGTTSSLNTFTSSANGRLTSIETSTSSLNTFTSSANGRLTSIETSTSSLNTFTSSASDRLTSIESATSSIRTDFNSFTSSNNSVESTQNGRLTSLENVTGSYATTGSNIFQGSQTITGSLFISQNLIVGGSSSINFISQSTLNIGTNLITVNAQNPGTRFGGLAVIDSGSSPTVSGSILFDSIKDEWLFIHQAIVGSPITSSVLLMGPETYNNVGNEAYLTLNRIPKGSGVEHLRDSNISDNGTTVTILSNTVINGTLSATGTTLVSGSSQVLLNSGIWSGSAQLPSGVVSGSSQIDHNSTTNYVANRHIDHSSVSISTGVGSGLTGGGDITTTRDLSIATGGVTNAMLAGSIENGKLTNSSLTIGTTAISLGGTSTTLAGLASVTSTAFTGSLQGNISGNAATVTTNANLTGIVTSSGNSTTIPNGNITNVMLANSSFFVGTTSISLGRTSALQTLNGVAIDGNAGSVTNGVYTTGDQTIGGAKTFSSNITNSATADWYMYGFGSRGASSGQYGMGLASDIANRTLSFHIPNLVAYSNSGNTPKFGWYSNGSAELMTLQSATGNLVVTGTIGASNLSGTNTGDETLSRVNALAITSVGTITSGVWNGTAIAVANGGTGASTAASAITNLGATTVGGNLFTLTNPSAIRFIRINANNTISTLSDSDFRTAIGAGTSSTTGTVTSVGGTGTVSGLSLSGTVTSTGNLTLSGTLTVAASNFSSQTANTFLAAPNGSSGTPTFRTIVAADVPTLNQNTTGTASNITAYTINQNVGTGNSPSFAGVTSSGTVAASGGASGGFLSSTYASGFNRIWAFGNSTGYGLGYYQGGTDYIGFHFGSTSSPQYSFFANGNMTLSGNITPTANGTQNLGSASFRWNTLFTSDLSLSNGIGDYTIVEGEEKLYLYNNKNNKVYSFVLQEEDPATAIPKRPE